jgi:DHA2 family methylenomycin A resistance protein-like MFS transporter
MEAFRGHRGRVNPSQTNQPTDQPISQPMAETMNESDAQDRRSAPADAAAAAGRTRGRPGLVLLVMCAGMFLVLLDVTVVNVAVPAITSGLGAGTAGIQWVVDGYAVALASLLLGGGTLGDRFGHRGIVLAGLVVFGAASAGCALAPGTGALIAARVCQGVGAALLLPGSIAAIVDAYPERETQARALGVWAGVSALALPAGPLLGGWIVQALGWRTVFWINPPVVALCVAGVLAWVHRPPRRDARDARDAQETRRVRRLDAPGLVLATVTLAGGVYAVISAGDGASPIAIGVAAGAAVAAGLGLVAVERRAASPMLPPALFSSPGFAGANSAALLMNLTSNGLLFLLTRYLQQILGHDPLVAGLMLLPLFTPLAVLSPLAGRLTARYGPYPVMVAGAVVAAAGQCSLLLLSPATGYLRLLPALVCVGIGIGLFTAPVVTAAIRAVPADRSGLASGINNTARQSGTALGVAIYGALAGSPADPGHFITVLRLLGAAAAVCWILVAAVTATAARTARRHAS